MEDGNRDKYSTREGCTSANASEIFCGIAPESLGVDADDGPALGEASLGKSPVAEAGEPVEVVKQPLAAEPLAVGLCPFVLPLCCLFGRFRERSLDVMTRVWPPKIARRDALISASGPMWNEISRAGLACLLRYC